MRKEDLKIREGDTTEITSIVPGEFVGGKVSLLVLLSVDEGILKEIDPAPAKVAFTLEENDTVTRIGKYKYEIRATKGDDALVLVQGCLTVEDSIIVRTDLTPSDPVAIIVGGSGGSGSIDGGNASSTYTKHDYIDGGNANG